MGHLFLHGLGQTPDSWSEIITGLHLSEPGICPCLSTLLDGRDAAYQTLYAAISALCGQSEEALDLCGLSLGGVLALHYAAEHPSRVRSLVLIAPQYKMPRKLLALQNLLFRLLPPPAFQSTGLEKRACIRLCATMADLDFSSALPRIACPTLILYGERDSANKKAALELADRIEGAQLQAVPGAGHEVNRDAPEALTRILRAFYADLS